MKAKRSFSFPWLFWGFLIFICTTTTWAVQTYRPQIADPILAPWLWHLYPELNGKGIYCMVEAADGSVWFGTEKGVYRYDGQTWVTFTSDDSLLERSVLGFLESRDGRIYASTKLGISRFEGGRWHKIFSYSTPYPTDWRIISLIEASDGSIWAGFPNGALQIQYPKLIFYTTKALSDSVKKMAPSAEISLVPEQVAKRISEFNIYSVFEDTEGNLWFGFFGGEICQYNPPNNWRLVHKTDKKPHIDQTRDRRIWVISDGADDQHSGPWFYSPSIDTAWHQINLKSVGGNHVNSSFLQTKDGTIWIGGMGNLHVFKNGRWHIYDSSNTPIPSSPQLFCFESFDGSIWIYGYQNHMYRIEYTDSRWVTYLGLNFQFDTEDDSEWFISGDNGVVCHHNGEWIRYSTEDGLIDAPSTLLCTRKGEIWAAGSHKHNAATAFFDGNRWHRKVLYKVSWSIDYRAAFEALDGTLYFGAAVDKVSERGDLGGLLKCDPFEKDVNKVWTHLKPSVTGHSAFFGIGQTADSTLWLGRNALIRFDGKTSTVISDPKVLKDTYIDCIENSENGHLWLGTRGHGVYYFNGEIWQNYTVEKNGMASNTIISLLLTSDTTAWAATDKDICYFDGNTWTTNLFPEQMTIEKEGGTLKMSRDGTLWVNKSSRSWFRRSRPGNRLYQEILSDYCTVACYPDHSVPDTEIIMYEPKVSQPGNTILAWRGSDPWKMTSDEDLQYSYRLDREKWSPYVSETNHIFLSLSSGNHVFEVRARDKSLNVDPIPARVEFKVLPALWQTGGFKFLILFIIFCLFFTVYKVWTNSIQKRNKQLEDINVRLNEQIGERKRAEDRIKASLMEKEVLLKEIHHRVKNNLQVICSLLSLQSRSIKNKKVLNMFRESQDRVRSMAMVHNKLYESQNLAEVDFAGYIQSLTNSLYQSYRVNTEKVRIELEVGNISLNIDLAIPCGLIINELVSNALKYAFPQTWKGSGKIGISFFKGEDNEMELMVSDNGVGLPEHIDLENLDSFGLRLVTLLVKDQLQGEIILDRIEGTKFQIRFMG